MIVESSYLLPVLVSVFFLILYAVFYHHDKMILNEAAGDTAEVGTKFYRQQKSIQLDLREFYRERVGDKLLLLHLNGVFVDFDGDKIKVTAKAPFME